jgi:hypothetical protein
VTQPSVDTQSGEAAAAVRTLQVELSRDYSEIRCAEIQLAEAILNAHAVTVSGRARLHDIQRQLIEAITDPVAALDTPAGERQFLLFLRGKIAEIQQIVDTGALTDEDHAKLTRALGSGYLISGSGSGEASTTAPAAPAAAPPAPDQGAGMVGALGSALGALPQALMGAVTAPAQAAGGLAGAAAPLAGLASGVAEHGGESAVDDARAPEPDTLDRDVDETEDEAGSDGDEDTPARPADPPPPSDREPPHHKPAPTRPARLLEEHR